MRVMIMAAGKGTRLRPLTELLPKPMVPVVNRPALYHILHLLHRHGFREAVINLHHMPEAITGYLGNGSWMDMEITYSFEPELLGTAGGVKNNATFLGEDTFLVVSGDALTDIDLTGLVAAHRRHGSIATLAVKEVSDPSLYGVVVADDDDRVVGFQEKPSLEEARSRMCNCGIYVFEPEILTHILEEQFDDFGRRVFPDLLKQRIPFHIESVSGYWSDVGNLGEYVQGNADALNRLVEVEIPGNEIRPDVWVESEAVVASTARLEPPVAVGQGAVLGEEVVVEGPAIVGEGSVLDRGSHVARSLLLPGSHLSAGSVVIDGVMGRNLPS